MRSLCRLISEYHDGTPRRGLFAQLYHNFKEGGRLLEELAQGGTEGENSKLGMLGANPVSSRMEYDMVRGCCIIISCHSTPDEEQDLQCERTQLRGRAYFDQGNICSFLFETFLTLCSED